MPSSETETIPPTIATSLKKASARLTDISNTPRLDADILLCFVLDKTRTWLYARPDAPLSSQACQKFTLLVNQRVAGMPVAYLTGVQEFWSLSLSVNESVLIPRADTELLVEKTLTAVRGVNEARVLELGTGSGAIALALAQERPDLVIMASDRSADALIVAAANQSRLGNRNIKWLESDWFEQITTAEFGLFDAIVSNPPYVSATDLHLEAQGIRFEPRVALVSGEDGLDDIRTIIVQARDHLVNDGWLLLEHGYQQTADVGDLLTTNGYNRISTCKDAGDNDRVTQAQV